MDLWNRRGPRILCAEPLEGRWLLSALAPHSEVSAAPTQTRIEVIEVDNATDDPPDVQLDPAKLPVPILAAINGRFPGAKVLSASSSDSDGPLEYTVETTFNGQSVEVTLTPGGRIKETGVTISAGTLPPAVLDWVHAHFADSQLDQAAVVSKWNGQSYDLVLLAPGDQVIEATVRLHVDRLPTSSTLFSDDPFKVVADDSMMSQQGVKAQVPSPDSEDAAPGADDSSARPVMPTAESKPASPQPTATPNNSRRQGSSLPGEHQQRTIAALLSTIWSDQRIRAIDALFTVVESATRTTSDWLPQLAGMVSDVFPKDLDAIEERMQQLMRRIDSLGEGTTTESGLHREASRAVIVTALVAAAYLLVLDSKRRRGRPLVVFSNANSSWSWLLRSDFHGRSRSVVRRAPTSNPVEP